MIHPFIVAVIDSIDQLLKKLSRLRFTQPLGIYLEKKFREIRNFTRKIIGLIEQLSLIGVDSHHLIRKLSTRNVFHYNVDFFLCTENLSTGAGIEIFTSPRKKNDPHYRLKFGYVTSCMRTMLGWFRSFIVLISLCTWHWKWSHEKEDRLSYLFDFQKGVDRTCLRHEVTLHDHVFVDDFHRNTLAICAVHSQLNLGKHALPDRPANLVFAYVVWKPHSLFWGETKRKQVEEKKSQMACSPILSLYFSTTMNAF